MIKEILFSHCKAHLEKRIQTLEHRKKSLLHDLSAETKSSAGDKHETGRAMIQLEREKLGTQIKVLELNQKKLHSIKAHQNSHQNTIGLGSIVFTDKANYYISIAADFCKIDSKIFYCISSQSPIGRLLIGKTINDSIKFNGTDSTIHKVL